MVTIFNTSRWLSEPTAYWTINYEAKRSGTSTLIRFYWKVWLNRSTSYYYDGLQLQLFLNGTQKNITVKGSNQNEEGWSYEGTTGWYTIANKTSGTVPFYAKLYNTNINKVKVTSSSYNLAVAPTVTQTIVSRTETSVTVQWQSDSAIDYVWYSLNASTEWVAVGSVANSKSGTYTVNGLKASDQHTIETRVRQKEGQLTGMSGQAIFWTYDFPQCIESPNFKIGSAVTLKFYNPLNRSFKFYIIANNKQLTTAYTCSSTSFKGLNDTTTIDELYNTIPNSQSGNYKVKVVYGSSQKERANGNTYSIKGTEVPKVGSISYKDSNSFVSGITGDNQLIVQNNSWLYVTYGKAEGQKGASIKGYSFVADGMSASIESPEGGSLTFKSVQQSSDFKLKMIVTDTRGLTSTKEMEVKVASHSEPTAMISLERTNNYEDETTLNVDADISSVNGKNSATIKYQYKEQDGEYNAYKVISERTDEVLSLSKDKNYIFRIYIEDRFGSLFVKEVPLGKGVFPFFIDTKKNAVGINDFPQEGEAMRVVDGIGHFVDGIKVRDKTLLDVLHPVGSVYCTSTNVSPSESLGGTWTLTGKEFSEKAEASVQCINRGDTEVNCSWLRNGHTIYLRFTFKSTFALIGTAGGEWIGQVDVESLGVSKLSYAKTSVGFSYDGDVVFQSGLGDDGILYLYDAIGKNANSISPNLNCFVEFVNVASHSHMLDSACDKFYWKRTA